jgi:hypothetical protein
VVKEIQFIKRVQDLACDNCEVVVYDLNKGCEINECEDKVKAYGEQAVPAVAIYGQLVDCCKNNGVDIEALKAAGLGQ